MPNQTHVERSLILSSQQITQKIDRMAWEIFENNSAETELVVVGIRSNGFLLAKRIAEVLSQISTIQVRLIELAINKQNPIEQKIELPINELQGRVIIVVDDVLNSGKTLMYGVKPFLSVPVKCLQTAVLVDRNHNRYPIKSDYTGLSLATTLREHVVVELDVAGKEAAYLT
jgi:pyrimidine operon attenuation protein/uracil phosphoribosyltransferase